MGQSVVGEQRPVRWYREITWTQWKALIAGWGVWTLDGVDFLVLTYVLSDIAKHFNIPLSTTSILLLMTYGVRWLGGLLFGNLSDRIGRRMPMIIACSWFTVCAVLTGVSWSFASIIVFRLLLGIGMAPGYALGATLVGETWPKKYRAIGIGLQDTGWGTGGILASLTYLWVYPHFGWRGVFFVGIIPALLLIWFISVAVKESPIWQEQIRTKTKIERQPMFQLFSKHLGKVIFLTVLMFCLFFSNWPLLGLFPSYLKSLHFTHTTISTLGLTISIGQLIGFAASGFIAEKFGRKKGLIYMFLAGIPSVIILTAVVHSFFWAEIWAFICGAFIIGSAGIWGSILAENLPTEVRASGVGFLYNIGSLGGGLAPFVVLAVLHGSHISFGAGLAGATIAASVISIIVLLFVHETKGVNLDNIGDEHDPGEISITDPLGSSHT
ncbi:MFS transporter [Alicyclobacillus tolerans]|uniref:MFS transporter n=1 Tax=Alicyclobacillus tolerans TaxID=90970 RepID=UPI001F0165E4|nr:MFS transporter [Alicyclobacillus tolerans]MCF8565600.1 MFS transporter [Alicyclobacillus tolerans]